jgi:hypothetical protein
MKEESNAGSIHTNHISGDTVSHNTIPDVKSPAVSQKWRRQKDMAEYDLGQRTGEKRKILRVALRQAPIYTPCKIGVGVSQLGPKQRINAAEDR